MPQNIPALITYEQIWDLAVSMAGQTQDNVTEKDSVLMQVFLAGELPDLWNKEAWPELCDNLTQVSLANNAFSLNQGDPNEMGEILGWYPQDPRNPSHGGTGYDPTAIGRVTARSTWIPAWHKFGWTINYPCRICWTLR